VTSLSFGVVVWVEERGKRRGSSPGGEDHQFSLSPIVLPALRNDKHHFLAPSMDDASLGASMLHRSLMTGRGNRRTFEQGGSRQFLLHLGALTFVTRDIYYLLWGDTSELRGSWHHQCIFYMLLGGSRRPEILTVLWGLFRLEKREKEKDARGSCAKGCSGCTPHSLGLWQVALVTQRH
jgi:hypothetical protein